MWLYIKKNLKVYLIVVLVFTLFVSIGLVIEKTYFGNFTTITGMHHVESILEIKQGTKESNNKKLDFSRFGKTYSFLEGYYQESKKEIKYEILFPGWNNNNPEEKIKTLQKHLYLEDLGSNVYACFIRIGNLNNIDEVTKYSDLFIDRYVSYSENEIKKINEGISISVIEKSVFRPLITNIDKKTILLKYGYIGALLGCLIGILITLTHAYRGYRNG